MSNVYKKCTACKKVEIHVNERKTTCPECGEKKSLIPYKPWWAYGDEDEYIGLTKKLGGMV